MGKFEAEYGIYIRGKRIMDMILNREKVIETRTHNKLDRFVGQRVGLILTGYGKPKLVGYAYLDCVYEFKTEKDFRFWESLHRIEEGSRYDWDGKHKKYGYLLGDVEKLDSPIELPVIKGNRMWRGLE